MSKRFFIRFNLHKSADKFPVNKDVFEPFVNENTDWIESCLNDFDDIQNKRAKVLKDKYPKELESLKGKKVVFLGDSITSDNLGYRTSVTKAAELCEIDCSISGATSAMILQSAYMMQKEMPDIVSIMIGANDTKGFGSENLNCVSIDEYERNLTEMIRWSVQSGAKTVLLGITPIVKERYENHFKPQGIFGSNRVVERYNEVLKKLALTYNIKFLDNDWIKEREDICELFEPDGIHLSVKGHDIFAEEWIKAVAEIIQIF